MKIGILGGTFNPIHVGHLILAEQVTEILKLDTIIFVPTSLPPHKDNGDIANPRDRYAMIKRAISGNRKFNVSDVEIKRGGRSYTVETLKALHASHPRDELYFITGSDLLKYLEAWKDIADVFSLAKFVVASRPGYPLENLPKEIISIPIKAVDICAYDLRQRIREGRSIKYYVPDAVIAYIAKKGLYR